MPKYFVKSSIGKVVNKKATGDPNPNIAKRLAAFKTFFRYDQGLFKYIWPFSEH